MTAADLQLSSYRLGSLRVEFNDAWLQEDARAVEETYVVEPDVGFYATDDDEEHLVRLSISCRPLEDLDGVCRYRIIDVTVWGIFTVSDDLSDEQRDTLLGYNTVSILHGIIRGLLISVTGGCIDGPFLLPAVNYLEHLRAVVAEATEGADQPADGDALRPDAAPSVPKTRGRKRPRPDK